MIHAAPSRWPSRLAKTQSADRPHGAPTSQGTSAGAARAAQRSRASTDQRRQQHQQRHLAARPSAARRRSRPTARPPWRSRAPPPARRSGCARARPRPAARQPAAPGRPGPSGDRAIPASRALCVLFQGDRFRRRGPRGRACHLGGAAIIAGPHVIGPSIAAVESVQSVLIERKRQAKEKGRTRRPSASCEGSESVAAVLLGAVSRRGRPCRPCRARRQRP